MINCSCLKRHLPAGDWNFDIFNGSPRQARYQLKEWKTYGRQCYTWLCRALDRLWSGLQAYTHTNHCVYLSSATWHTMSEMKQKETIYVDIKRTISGFVRPYVDGTYRRASRMTSDAWRDEFQPHLSNNDYTPHISVPFESLSVCTVNIDL